MDHLDIVTLALTIWRENRGGGSEGMGSVANVIQNRAKRRSLSVYEICVQRLQFSSMTAKGDPELILWPEREDASWNVALQIANAAAAGNLEDATGGAVLYYAPRGISSHTTYKLPTGVTVPFPDDWNPKVVTYTATIQNQIFFK